MQQSKLNKSTYITLITLLSMIPPLATDLYMPAMPEMVEVFGTTSSTVGFTMTIFFIFMAVGIVIFGPLSDKWGRKPILLISITFTFLFSLVCAFSPSITILIVARAFQAFGAGGMVAIATTLIKDSFDGPEMGKVLSITQALMLIAPMIAPVSGAIILSFADWNMTFIALAILNLITLIFALLLDETLPAASRLQGSTVQSIWNITQVIKNLRFTSLLLIGGLLAAPFMAYLSVASYVYVNQFHTSEMTFSIYFALTSAFAIVGPLLFMRFGRKAFNKVMLWSFVIILTSGILLMTIGQLTPVLFLMSYIPFVIMKTYLRPFISEVILTQQRENIGATSAMMNFGFTMIGSMGMLIGSLKWSNYVIGISSTILIFTGATILLFIVASKRKLFEGL